MNYLLKIASISAMGLLLWACAEGSAPGAEGAESMNNPLEGIVEDNATEASTTTSSQDSSARKIAAAEGIAVDRLTKASAAEVAKIMENRYGPSDFVIGQVTSDDYNGPGLYSSFVGSIGNVDIEGVDILQMSEIRDDGTVVLRAAKVQTCRQDQPNRCTGNGTGAGTISIYKVDGGTNKIGVFIRYNVRNIMAGRLNANWNGRGRFSDEMILSKR